MCWKCDHPESTVEEWLDDIRETIVAHGWAVQYVESERTPYGYTVGLHERGLPELLLTGLAPQRTVRLLNAVAEYLVGGGKPTPGHRISIAGEVLCEVVQVEQPDAHLNVAVACYGRDLRALQLVWADGRGRLPWDEGFSADSGRQPVLGVRVCPH